MCSTWAGPARRSYAVVCVGERCVAAAVATGQKRGDAACTVAASGGVLPSDGALRCALARAFVCRARCEAIALGGAGALLGGERR